MTRSRVLAVVAAGLLVLVGGGVLIHERTTSDAPAKAGSSATSAGAKRAKTAPDGAEPIKGGGTTSEIAPVQTEPEALPGSTSSGLPGLTPARSGPIVKDPLPAAATRKRGVVKGYPVRVLRVVPASTIRSSSVSPSPGRLQVALDARTGSSGAEVLRFYAVRLSRWGFVSTASPATAGSQAASYDRGADSLVVTVTPAAVGGTRYTVYGTLHTKS